MMEVVQNWADQYMKWQGRNADPGLGDKPLMNSPLPTAVILIFYILIVYTGPRIMRKRQAWDLQTYNAIYNIAQILFCAAFVTKAYQLSEIKPKGLYLMCKIYDRSNSKEAREIIFMQYINLIVRLIELSESLVHILRKKERQLSYLHVIHHILNVLIAWGLCRFYPGGTSLTLCMLNFGIHFIMYSYYLAASSSNRLLIKLTGLVKKFITIIQMVQFVYMLVILSQDMGMYPPCTTGSFMTKFAFLCIATDLILFINFYRVNYVKKKKSL